MAVLVTYADASPSSAREGRIKSAVLYNILKFISWPDQRFETKKQSIQLCIVGDDPLNDFIENTVKSKSIQGRSIKVEKNTKTLEELPNCHMIYFGTMAYSKLKASLKAVKEKTVLTVGVEENFLDLGGVIKIFKKKNNLRLRVNISNSKSQKVEISSELLNVAVIE